MSLKPHVTQVYKCPYCGHELKEVSIIELSAKQLLVSAGIGFGIGMILMPIAPKIGLLGTLGAFILAFTLTFILLKRR